LRRGLMSVRLVSLLLVALPALFGEDPALAPAAEIAQTSGAASFQAGRNYFMLGDYKKASEAFQKALALEPGNSQFALWLGRSFGRRAETALPFSAPKYASKARGYFEKAVALDPHNEEALSGLFDYYLEAPGFLGGGYDKAETIAQRIAERNPAEGQFAQARLADRRRQFDTPAEQVGRVLDLARYLAKRGRIQESEAAFDKAEQLAPNSPKVAVARAQIFREASGR